MEINEFSNKLKNLAQKINLIINDDEVKNFYEYMNLLIKWNEKMNLTAIIEPDEVILKHFIDCLTLQKYVKDFSNIIDIGTGAGFPGVPLSILNNNCKVTLMDSLNKRIKFLDEVSNKINSKNIDTIHARAEELAQNIHYREKFECATSRAVAPLNVLLEYMLPFVKVNGYCICMKGSNIEEEILNSKESLEILGGVIEEVVNFYLPDSDIGRSIVIIKKIKQTPKKYPRKAGTPSKEPIT